MVPWLRIHFCKAGDAGSIPGWGTKIPHATEQLNNRKSMCLNERSYMLQLRLNAAYIYIYIYTHTVRALFIFFNQKSKPHILSRKTLEGCFPHSSVGK